ncbi:MAG: hypothetical protein WC924_02230 [Candidatus Gracilibacteria bacterium]
MREKENYIPEINAEEKQPEEILLSIIDKQCVPPAEYQRLISQQELRGGKGRAVQSWYAVLWRNLLKEDQVFAIEFFRQHLSGQNLIDLGGGTGSMGEVATGLNSGVYVNVERAPFESSEITNPLVPIFSESKNNFLQMGVHSDMLDFVSRMKDSVGNFTINGIDTIIVNDMHYNRALAHEMIRATRKGGLIFGTSSDALVYIDFLIKKGGVALTTIDPKKLGLQVDDETFIFEKTR